MNKQPCITPHGIVHQMLTKYHEHTLYIVCMCNDDRSSEQKYRTQHYLVRTPICAAPSSVEWSPCTAEYRPSCAGTIKQTRHEHVLALQHANAVHSRLSYWTKMEQRELDCDGFPTGWGKVSSDWRELRPPWEALQPASLSVMHFNSGNMPLDVYRHWQIKDLKRHSECLMQNQNKSDDWSRCVLSYICRKTAE